MTNAVGEVRKFSTRLAYAGESAPLETQSIWDYLDALRPHAHIEMHAHFPDPDFSRSIGMQEIDSLPQELRETAAALQRAIDAHYHQSESRNRRVRIDTREEEGDVYGVREAAERFGTVGIFLQAIPDPLEAHNADVLDCITTVAGALISSY